MRRLYPNITNIHTTFTNPPPPEPRRLLHIARDHASFDQHPIASWTTMPFYPSYSKMEITSNLEVLEHSLKNWREIGKTMILHPYTKQNPNERMMLNLYQCLFLNRLGNSYFQSMYTYTILSQADQMILSIDLQIVISRPPDKQQYTSFIMLSLILYYQCTVYDN